MKNSKSMTIANAKKAVFMMALMLASNVVFAQGGGAAIDGAATEIGSYITPVGTIIQAIGALVGLIGGIRIYNKWQNGDRDINKELLGWGGACIFLLLVPTFLGAMFPAVTP